MADLPLSVTTDEYSSSTADAGVSTTRPMKSAPRNSWVNFAFKGLVLLIFILWVVDAGISLLIHDPGIQKKLTARLEAAFGRPVEVGRYNFSIWTGPVLEAQSVVVSEDPRFGPEYFLRAESLRVHLRWQSLLRRRLELGTLSLTQPSLNVVRNAEGDWNLGEWLPRPAARLFARSALATTSFLRFERIDVDGGRVNFKRADEKLPFAFVDVKGTVEADGPGRWRMDIAATPWRASVLTQRAGSIHIAGHVGGTSSRLLPAVLDSTWTDASVSDALRLIRGDDYGVRGSLSVVLSARTDDDGWKLQTRAEMRQLHRWDLSLRPDNPPLNLIAQMRIGASDSGVELTNATLEAPHSSAHITGRFFWNGVELTSKASQPPLIVSVSDSNIDSADVLAWARAFHAGIADDVAMQGAARTSGIVRGWPPRLDSAKFTTDGADLKGHGLRLPIHLAKVELNYEPDHVSLSPVTLSFGPPKGPFDGSLTIDRSLKPRAKAATWRLTGSMKQVRDLTTAAGSLGWNLSPGGDLAGPFRCDLRWQEPQMPSSSPPAGFIELGGSDEEDGASLRSAFLNRPIEQIRVRADWKPGSRHVALSSAQAFGARWNGTFDRRDLDDQWQFILSADHLSASDADLWLNPRWRESFIDRMLPFLNIRAAANAVPETLRASGRLSINQLTVAPVVVRRLQGTAALSGRHFELTEASGQFYGGTVSGMFIADLKAIPTYQVNADFARVDLSALAAASRTTDGLFDGTGNGQIFFTTNGASRADLVSSVQCRGSADVDEPKLQNINLAESLREAALQPGTSVFHDASAAFTCASGKIQFHDFALVDPAWEIDGAGSVDFSHVLDFRLTLVPNSASSSSLLSSADARTSVSRSDAYQLTGPLGAPQLTRIPSSPHRPR